MTPEQLAFLTDSERAELSDPILSSCNPGLVAWKWAAKLAEARRDLEMAKDERQHAEDTADAAPKELQQCGKDCVTVLDDCAEQLNKLAACNAAREKAVEALKTCDADLPGLSRWWFSDSAVAEALVANEAYEFCRLLHGHGIGEDSGLSFCGRETMTPIEEKLAELEAKAQEPDAFGIDAPEERWLLRALREAVELAKSIKGPQLTDYVGLHAKAAAFLRGEFGTGSKGESE